MRKRILRPDHENKGVPTKTHGAKRGSAPSSTHLSKRTLKRSAPAPKQTHSRRNPIANLGDYAHKAKLPSGRKIGAVKSVAKAIKSTAKQRVY